MKPLFLLLAVVLASHTAGAADWPQFRGPNGSGIGDGQPPVEFGPSQNLLWKTAVGAGLSSPVIAKGRVFLTDFDRATKQLSTLCLDQRTGVDPRPAAGEIADHEAEPVAGEIIERQLGTCELPAVHMADAAAATGATRSHVRSTSASSSIWKQPNDR